MNAPAVTLVLLFDPRNIRVSSASPEEWIAYLELWEDALLAIKAALVMLLGAYKVDIVGLAWVTFIFIFPEVLLKFNLRNLRQQSRLPTDPSSQPHQPRDDIS